MNKKSSFISHMSQMNRKTKDVLINIRIEGQVSGHACYLFFSGYEKALHWIKSVFRKLSQDLDWRDSQIFHGLKTLLELRFEPMFCWDGYKHLLPYPSKLILKALQSFGLTWWTRCTFLSCYSCIYILKEKNGEVLNPLVTGKLQQRRFLWTFVRNSDQSDIHLISYLAEWIENNKTEKFGPIRQGKGKFSSVVFSFNFVIFIEFCLVARIF